LKDSAQSANNHLLKINFLGGILAMSASVKIGVNKFFEKYHLAGLFKTN
jgi:hypothetical protein